VRRWTPCKRGATILRLTRFSTEATAIGMQPKLMVRIMKPRLAQTLLLFTLVWGVSSAADKTPKETAERIVIEKSARTMTLMSGGQVLKTYKVALGNPVGTKEQEGDGKTPEGTYFIDSKNPHSHFHRALHISYPNPADRERARKLGVNPGGDVEIHGLPWTFGWLGSLHRIKDWTSGCIAVTNSEIEEIWPLVSVGTPVEIRP
jgi:murein L,D-transpeptidase YafK